VLHPGRFQRGLDLLPATFRQDTYARRTRRLQPPTYAWCVCEHSQRRTE